MCLVTKRVLGVNDAGKRIDRVLRQFLPAVPLSALYKMIRRKQICLNDVPVRPGVSGKEGDVLSFPSELLSGEKPEPGEGRDSSEESGRRESSEFILKPEILFENEDILAVNKPAGILTHGKDSLETAVTRYLAGRVSESLSFRPGPLHRLDRNTSGTVVFSVSLRGARQFSRLLQEGRLRKFYLALLDGVPEEPFFWDDLLVYDHRRRKSFLTGSHAERGAEEKRNQKERGRSRPGKRALSRMVPLCSLKTRKKTLALVTIQTGRTHQIRAQSAFHGFPLCGDKKYGRPAGHPYFLHALCLRGHPLVDRIPPVFSREQRQFFERFYPEMKIDKYPAKLYSQIKAPGNEAI